MKPAYNGTARKRNILRSRQVPFNRGIRSLDPRDSKILSLKSGFPDVCLPFKTDLTVLHKIVNLDYIANKRAWLRY